MVDAEEPASSVAELETLPVHRANFANWKYYVERQLQETGQLPLSVLEIIRTHSRRLLVHTQQNWSVDGKLDVRAFSKKGVVDSHGSAKITEAGRRCR
jgi:hypothetical protein